MSHWVYLQDDDGSVNVPRHEDGGTYQVGGTEKAELNITYNYTQCYLIAWDGDTLEWLDGKTAEATIPRLEWAVKLLGTRRYERDYWAPTPGNAGHALSILLGWARLHPTATWVVS